MNSNALNRGILALVVGVSFLAGTSVARLSGEPATKASDTVGGKWVEELEPVDVEHALEIKKLRNEIRGVIKTVRRAAIDKSMADEATAAPAKLSGLINKLLDSEAGFQNKVGASLIERRDALVAELARQMLTGQDPFPGVMGRLLPSGMASETERTEWNDLFKMVNRSARFDADGEGEDEGVD